MPTLTVILHVCSGSLAATRKGHSRACHFGTTFRFLVQKFLRLRRAQNFLSVSRLGPGSSPGRAESQLASELGELPLLGPQRAAVQQLPWPTAAATGTGTGNAPTQRESSRCSRQAQRAPAPICRRHSGSSRGRCRRLRAAAARECGDGVRRGVCVLAAAERVLRARDRRFHV